MSNPVVLPSFGGDKSVGSVATAYPFQPGVDLTNVLGASDGVASTELVKIGTFSVTGTASGSADDAITFAHAFPNATDAVLLTFTALGGATINGAAYAASVSATGFTATVDITTAGTGDITGVYVAFGH
ncbi:hypothetical protein [Sulfobacillus harzensis]|uniref:Uncharacterized protein n=1 Tax=Sulfobacillus harzensis TaxID=2729629 RepID=A0A7Y0L016_9FIRM|nr:hypothetical protein [Sulfobacillus harzensis]NMP20766.1 hypothetical protein [Sulfobacillus harzensis]